MLDMDLMGRYSQRQISQILKLSTSQVSNINLGQRFFTCLEVLRLQHSLQEPLLRIFDWKDDDRVFWNNVENFQSLLRARDHQIAEMFDLPAKSFRLSRANCRSLSWRACHHFEQTYHIHPALWFTNDIDIECIVKNICSPFKSNAYLPNKFEGGGSRMRSLANALQFVHKNWGEECAQALQGSMQIMPESLTFSEKKISIEVFAILHQKLRLLGAKDNDFISMGFNNRVNHKNRRLLAQKVPKHIKGLGNTMRFYIDELSENIDTNKYYKTLKLTKSAIIAKAVPRESFKDSFVSKKPYSEKEIALYGQGHLKTIPTYFGYPEFDRVEMLFSEETGEAIYTAYFS